MKDIKVQIQVQISEEEANKIFKAKLVELCGDYFVKKGKIYEMSRRSLTQKCGTSHYSIDAVLVKNPKPYIIHALRLWNALKTED